MLSLTPKCTYDLTSGLTAKVSLSIEGSVNDTIAATTTGFTLLTVKSGTMVALSGLALSGGSSTSGGAIANGGTLTITGSVVTGNTAGGTGGGILNAGGSVTLGLSIVVWNEPDNCAPSAPSPAAPAEHEDRLQFLPGYGRVLFGPNGAWFTPQSPPARDPYGATSASVSGSIAASLAARSGLRE